MQLQAPELLDEHSNHLSLTQSTFEVAEEKLAPPQERLKNVHFIVYPPRWEQLRDLAQRYAFIGIVTSAAEMFEEKERNIGEEADQHRMSVSVFYFAQRLVVIRLKTTQ